MSEVTAFQTWVTDCFNKTNTVERPTKRIYMNMEMFKGFRQWVGPEFDPIGMREIVQVFFMGAKFCVADVILFPLKDNIMILEDLHGVMKKFKYEVKND